MTHSAIKTLNLTDEPEEKQEDIEKIKVRLCLFFDGTLNNRINIEQREKAEKNPDAKAIYEKYAGGDNSYEGDHTNISKMEKCIDKAADYQLTLSIYTEGPGTQNKKKDKLAGYALGTGSTGVEKKVEKGIEEAATKLKNKLEGQFSKENLIIELVTIDVFGFSRGAAGARLCIHEVLNGKNPIKKRLEDENYKVTLVHVWFAGLFDTVSSHGVFYFNDVKDLKLKSVSLAKRTVQLAAAEEHRKKFSLTTIGSAGSYKGLQVFLPGVHSDIGGGYRANGAETDMGVYRSFSRESAEQEKQDLIEAGWYRKGEIEVIHYPPLHPDGFDQYVVEVTRKGIKNEYSKIPFNLMAKYVRQANLTFKPTIDLEKVPGGLSTIDKAIDAYVKEKGNKSRAEDWIGNQEPWQKDLRHDYLHFSAKLEFAHLPRFEDFQRHRKVYRG